MIIPWLDIFPNRHLLLGFHQLISTMNQFYFYFPTKLADACYTYRDRLIVMLLRETGVRRGELLGLHLVDVQDFDVKGRIRIVRRNDNPNGAKAKGTEREIPVLHNRQEIQETFHAYLLEEYPPEAEKAQHGMLFVNLDGKYIGKPMSSARLNDLSYQL